MLLSVLRLCNQIHRYFLLKINENSFCSAKASHIFSTKNIGIFEILTFEILTSRELTTLLVLNNQAKLYNQVATVSSRFLKH